ncbi:MAG: hypothetical protein AAF202_09735, partial [Pseudomonadota bacterium]
MSRLFRALTRGRRHCIPQWKMAKRCLALLAILVLHSSFTASGQGMNEFTGFASYSVTSETANFGYAYAVSTRAGEAVLPYRLRNPIQPGDRIRLTGYEIHIDRRTGAERIYYQVAHQPQGSDEFTQVTRSIRPSHIPEGETEPGANTNLGNLRGVSHGRAGLVETNLLLPAEQLVAMTGGAGVSPLTGCEQLPGHEADPHNYQSSETDASIRNLIDIADIRDALEAGNSLPVPALTEGFNRDGADCSAFITGEGELGPYGHVLANEMLNIGPDREVTRMKETRNGPVRLGHSDIPTSYFLNLPDGYFSHRGEDLCPNLGNMSSREKLALWVWIFTALAHDE